ncbi:hypothetical protein MMC25_005533 [Agyrium rufum]|nr:hypothetical protein [Agyrium rufum]
MSKALWGTSKVLQLRVHSFSPSCNTFIAHRTISTNSAIHRVLRKSRSGPVDERSAQFRQDKPRFDRQRPPGDGAYSSRRDEGFGRAERNASSFDRSGKDDQRRHSTRNFDRKEKADDVGRGRRDTHRQDRAVRKDRDFRPQFERAPRDKPQHDRAKTPSFGGRYPREQEENTRSEISDRRGGPIRNRDVGERGQASSFREGYRRDRHEVKRSETPDRRQRSSRDQDNGERTPPYSFQGRNDRPQRNSEEVGAASFKRSVDRDRGAGRDQDSSYQGWTPRPSPHSESMPYSRSSPSRSVETEQNHERSLVSNDDGGSAYAFDTPRGRRDNAGRGPRDFDSMSESETYSQKPLLPTMPYTTAASEFLYGTSVVVAALKSQRRKLYKLYKFKSNDIQALEQDKSIKLRAKRLGVEVIDVDGDWIRAMDSASSGRPHNGYILEASPLPKLPATCLNEMKGPQMALTVTLDTQSREDEAINGQSNNINYNHTHARYPFVLYLDQIVDPGNLGAIFRSAYFLGVDAVAVSTRNCASITPVVLKASAGACESIPLISVKNPAQFLQESQANGWKLHAAAPADPNKLSYQHMRQEARTLETLGSPLLDSPCILMLGNEGEGLREQLKKKADVTIEIEGLAERLKLVDSLNVSVASAILCEAYLRKPNREIEILGAPQKALEKEVVEKVNSELAREPIDLF